MSKPPKKAHSLLGASAAKRWMNCHGSISLIRKCPPVPSGPAAEEGTAAHELAETVFKNTPNAHWYVGKKKFNGYDVTEEMAGHVQDYVDYVRVIRNRLKGELLIEHKFHLEHLHPDFYGTCDAVVMQPFGELHVFDFKYGFGVVEVEDNEQVQYYALGALELGDFTKIVLHICQPRASHEDGKFRSWETTPEALLEFGKKLRAAALETQKKNAKLAAGEWCFFCPAAGVCPQLHSTAVEVARTDFMEPKLPDATMLTAAQVVKVIEHRKLIENWFDAVEAHALAELQAGKKIPGLKMVNGRSSRSWTDEAEAEKILKSKLGEAAYQKKLLSVAQAEKTPAKNLISGLILTQKGSIQVASEKDKRPAATPVQDDFEKIESEDF